MKLRDEGKCTMCSKLLPASKLGWGLVWDDKKTGICAKCLYEMRKTSGYFERADKTLAPKRRVPRERAPASQVEGSVSSDPSVPSVEEG